MKFQSAIISRGSGSIGGLTASHNKGGNYFRARTTPTDPGSPFQTTNRVNMGILVNLWEDTLTQAERDDWAVYATNTPLLDQFGEPRTVTALNMYCRVNIPNLQVGLPRRDIAPSAFNTGAFTPAVFAASEAGGLSIAFTDTDDWANEDDSALLVYAGRPQNVGINFFKGPYRFAGKADGDAITPPTSPLAIAAPPFPFIEGQKIFAQIRVVRADGRLSVKQRVEFIAIA